jgi:uncharacterized protein YdbL (DUF1318 family)
MAPPIMLSALLQVFLPVPVLAADLIADNLTVQDGKADGEIGEQADGMLGVVRGNPDSGVMGSVAELNTVRRDTYRQAAAKAGTTFQQEAEKAGEINIRETPAGQYYRAADGVWTKKK